MKRFLIIFCTILYLTGCKTVDFDKNTTDITTVSNKKITSLAEEQKIDEAKLKEVALEEELKEVDVEKTVIYIDRPVYFPVEEVKQPVKGKEAALSSLEAAIQKPWKYTGGTMFYDFQDNFVYEIYCQPYRITDLALEPGEQVLENPFLSESQVWQIGAGVSRKQGQDVQHFYLKPDMSGLTTSMIVITDRRVYHLLLKSFRDYHMAMVEFEYPNTMPYTVKKDAMNAQNAAYANDMNKVDAKFLSFDYKMSYSLFKKPVWLPKRVYDDGRKTYIQLDETVLHTESPVLFNKRNQRINYRVDKNLIIIDELTEKLTLRLGKEKVTITKKKFKGKDKEVDETPLENQEKINTVTRNVYKYHVGNSNILNGSQFGMEKKKPLEKKSTTTTTTEETK